MFPYIRDGNLKLFSLIFDFSTNILLRHSIFFLCPTFTNNFIHKGNGRFPKQRKILHTLSYIHLWDSCWSTDLYLWLGKADFLAIQNLITTNTIILCSETCSQFLEHRLENSTATETTKGSHSFCGEFMTYHLSRAGIHLAKGNVQIKARHVYLISWVRRERQFQAHKSIFQLKMVLKLCKCLPKTNCGYSIKLCVWFMECSQQYFLQNTSRCSL